MLAFQASDPGSNPGSRIFSHNIKYQKSEIYLVISAKLEQITSNPKFVSVKKGDFVGLKRRRVFDVLIDTSKGPLIKAQEPKIERFNGQFHVTVPVIFKGDGFILSFLTLVKYNLRYTLKNYTLTKVLLETLNETLENLSRVPLNTPDEKVFAIVESVNLSRLLKEIEYVYDPDLGIFKPGQIEEIKKEISRIKKQAELIDF